VAERFTFHDLRAHYTTHFKLKFGTLPDMHADPATTARCTTEAATCAGRASDTWERRLGNPHGC
jgi:hypothetical protein